MEEPLILFYRRENPEHCRDMDGEVITNTLINFGHAVGRFTPFVVPLPGSIPTLIVCPLEIPISQSSQDKDCITQFTIPH